MAKIPPEGTEWWVVNICPECRQQQGEASATHTGDCPNLGKIFAYHAVTVVEYTGPDLLSMPWRESNVKVFEDVDS